MNKHQPALLGGLLIGVLSALPVVSAGNACCCLWVVLGGVLTVYLQQQRTPQPVETSDAVLGGLLAGVIGGVIMMVIFAALTTMTGALWQDEVRRALENAPEITPEMRDGVLRLISGPGIFLLSVVVTLPLFAVFSMLGSLLGLAIFRKKTPPVPPSGPAPEVLQG